MVLSRGGDALGRSRVSRAEALAQRLETEITTQALPPGERLGTKGELRERFGVAVATMNEAVRLMEMRGLVAARPGPGGGVFVGEPADRNRASHTLLGFNWEHATLRDCLEVRDALEPVVASKAAAARTDADIADLEERLQAMIDARDDPQGYLRANWSLHRKVASICDNTPLRSVYLTVIDFLAAGVDDFDFPGPTEEDLEVHRELVKGIAAGAGPEVEAAARWHIDRSPLRRGV
jgi:DNA-binding FadR family transcriptional regulator